MITGDLDLALATEVSSTGTWRPAPPGAAHRPRAYTTTVAFQLAGGHDGPVAAGLAARRAGLDWVAAATVTGGGYLTVTVTASALARLAVRVTEAGQGCARASALTGTAVTAPAAPGLPSAHAWEEARRRVHASITGRLAEAAGAAVTWTNNDAERMVATHPVPGAPRQVADAIAYAGADAVVYALARLPPWGRARVDARSAAAHRLENPAYAVRYAHAHAASTLRQAADLGLDRGEAAGFGPRLLAHPCEQALLNELSWLPERVTGAARRRRPDVLAHFLEGLALAYFDCQETCPAVRPGGWPGELTAQAGAARLWLAAAARTALRAGLGLLGVDAPDRL